MPNNFPEWSGTWIDVKGFAGKTPWFTENWSVLVDRVEDIADVINIATGGYTTLNERHVAHEATTTEVIAARGGYGTLLLKEQAQDTAITSITNEVNAARDGYGTLLLKEQAQDIAIFQKLSEATGLTQNLDGNTYRAVNFSNAVDLQDLTTLSQVNAIALGGGSPSAIPITDLNIGTATTNQKIKVNGTGDAIIGVDDVTDVTGLDVGSATANQIIRVNPTGDAIVGEDQSDFAITGFGVGSATANSIIAINDAGNAITYREPAYGGISGNDNWTFTSDGTFRLDLTSINTPMPLNNATIPSYPNTVSITSFSDNGSGGTTCTSTGHGLAENDTVSFTYNGETIHRIFNVTTNTFDIGVAYTTSPTSATAFIYTVLRTIGSGLYLINFSGYIHHTTNSSNEKTLTVYLYANGELVKSFASQISGDTSGNGYKTVSGTHYIHSTNENNSFGCRIQVFVGGSTSTIRFYLSQSTFQVLKVSA